LTFDVRAREADASSILWAVQLLGLAPFVPPSRPRADAAWWRATGCVEDGRIRIERLEERADPGPFSSPCGLAAPCSLPDEFLAWADGDVTTWTRDRLLREARLFAARRTRGQRHPKRPGESAPSLDRRRLVRYHAALPLLASHGNAITEVDVISWLRERELPATGLAGSSAQAIARRAAILREIDVDVAERDYAVGSWPALEAVIACRAVAT
jgi:hypothetical protein